MGAPAYAVVAAKPGYPAIVPKPRAEVAGAAMVVGMFEYAVGAGQQIWCGTPLEYAVGVVWYAIVAGVATFEYAIVVGAMAVVMGTPTDIFK